MQQCGLVHRDVKSTNILLRPCTEDPTKMVVKIADLGAPPALFPPHHRPAPNPGAVDPRSRGRDAGKYAGHSRRLRENKTLKVNGQWAVVDGQQEAVKLKPF
eukprot:7695392-Pyramimonas_sp.AAC.1